MKKGREIKVGTGVKMPKSKKMSGSNNKDSVGKKIREHKEKQRKLFRIIKDEMKKADQFRISLDGLQSLSDSSINSIQMNREKALTKIKYAVLELLENTKNLKKTENKLRKSS